MRSKKSKGYAKVRFIEEKTLRGGDFAEIKIFQADTKQRQRSPSPVRRKISPEKIAAMNEKNAKRHFIALVNQNFGEGDYHACCTYSGEPPPLEIAQKIAAEFLRRLKKIYTAAGVDFRYIQIHEYGGKNERVHHHILLPKGIPREVIEDEWRHGLIWRRLGASPGACNCDRLIPNRDEGLQAIALYLTKRPANRKKWSGSRNLRPPEEITNDTRYGFSAFRKLIRAIREERGAQAIERIYRGWRCVEVRREENPITRLEEISVKLARTG